MGRALAVVIVATVGVVGPARDARAEPRLEPPTVKVRRVAGAPCDPSSVLSTARAARDGVDPRSPDAARRRWEAYRDAFLERVGTCLDERLAWAASAKTGPTTWAKAQGAISDSFMELWRGGALVGARPEHAFFARCDRSSMTNADIDAGLLVCTYGLALVRPAELEPGTVRVRTSGTELGKTRGAFRPRP